MSRIPLTYEQRFIYDAIRAWGVNPLWSHNVACVHVKGTIDIAQFETASTLLAVHSALSARLEFIDGQPVQHAVRTAVPFELIDLAGATDDVVSATLSARADQAFDLACESPLRIVLVTTNDDDDDDDDAVLLLVGHHVFFDRAGMNILLADYLRAYARLSSSPDAASAIRPSDYFDYAARQRRALIGDEFRDKVRYWQTELNHADPAFQLNGRGSDPATESLKILPFRLDPGTVAALDGVARQRRVTLFTTIAQAIYSALWNFTEQDDLLLAVVTDSRRGEFHNTVGQFADMFPLRAQRADFAASEVSSRVIFAKLTESMHRFVPSSYLSEQIDWLADRTSTRGICDILVDYLPPDSMETMIPGVWGNEISEFPLRHRAAPPAVSFHGVLLGFIISYTGGSLSGLLQYESAIVSEETARAILASWLDALDNLTKRNDPRAGRTVGMGPGKR